MTATSKAIFKSGWAIFLAAGAIISLALDLAQPSFTAPNGRQIFLLGPGSATLGWLSIVITIVAPAFILREVRKAPVPKWLAVCWLIAAWILWALAHTLDYESSGQPPRFNFTIFGGLVLCWRFLSWAPIQTQPRFVPTVHKTFYFRRGPTGRIEGPGPLLHIRAHLMKQGGLAGVEYVENTGVPIEQITATAWKPL
jgi:hypothetical protein